MQAEQSKYHSNSLFEGNLYKNYPWFYENFANTINEATLEFLGNNVDLKLVSVSEQENILFAGEEYFVTKVRITKDLNVLMRISKTAIQNILEAVLGKNKEPFSLEKITELEVKILTSFNDFLYKHFSENLLDLKNSTKKIKHYYDCHLTYFVKTENEDLGKLIISIPSVALPEIPVAEPVYTFSINDFPETKVAVNLQVGSTKLSLNDVKNIEQDDIVLLENSNVHKMTLLTGSIKKEFKLTPNPSLILDIDDEDAQTDEGENMADNKTTSNMWDSIQVDISAEFEQVKIPLGDLRQISEGLVVDIGSVYENKIDLKVENKVIASGELVIINDRYGIRVDTVYNSKESETIDSTQDAEVQENSSSEKEGEDFNEEDFDYSNFEIEDENI